MGLIEAILAIFFAIFVAALSRQMADEFKAWTPWLIDVLVRQAITGLPEYQRERYAEEWRSHIEEIPGHIGKLVVALSLLSAPWKLSRILPNTHAITSAAEVTLPVPVLLGWPSAVTLPDNSPAGTVLASGLIVMSDGSAFTGTITVTDGAGNPAPVIFLPDDPPLPLTLGNAAVTRARFFVGCLDCGYRIEPDPAEMAECHGTETSVPDWRSRLVCGQCGSRRIDMVVSGTERRD